MVIFRSWGLFGQLEKWLFPIWSPPYNQRKWTCPFFFRDCWEEDGVCQGLDFGEAGVVTVQCKGKQSSALVYSRVPRVGWEAGGCSFSHISVERNSFWWALLCHFWCDRAGRARPFWCAVTRKYGGAARGSQRAKQHCGPEPLGQQDAVLYFVLTYIEQVRKTVIVLPPKLVSWWGVLLEVVSLKGGDFLRQDGLCENKHTVTIHGQVEGMITKKWRKRTRCAF